MLYGKVQLDPPKRSAYLKTTQRFLEILKKDHKNRSQQGEITFFTLFSKMNIFFEFFVFQNLILWWENTKSISLKSEFPLLAFQKDAYILSFFNLLCQMLNVILFFTKFTKNCKKLCLPRKWQKRELFSWFFTCLEH